MERKIVNQTLKQLLLTGSGQPDEVVELHDGVITTLAPNEVLVEMEAAPIDWFRITPKEQIETLITYLSQLVTEGKLSATVGGTFPIERYKDAFQAAGQPGRSGKYFLTSNP